MYSYEDALSSSLAYFNGDELVASTFLNKYALKDKAGNLHEKSPDDMHDRLAKEFARIDKDKYGKDGYEIRYRACLDKFQRVVPQGSPMSAVGNPFQVMSASNCVVIESPEDSIGGIMRSATELAQLYKRRCGVGLDISTLRPDGMPVNNAARTTSGAWSFSDLFSFITRMVGQNSRRGALMITLDVHHPDVEKFALMKQDLTKVTGANVSIKASDEFMQAVENDSLYEQRWPLQGEPKFKRMVPARQVWNTIINCATKTAEPCIVFWDRILKYTPTYAYNWSRSISLNPCAEISLCANDSCRLISMNLTGYIVNPFSQRPFFDMSAFKHDIALAVRMADNLVDIEIELIDNILKHCDDEDERILWKKLQETGRKGRRVGLGTHALADALAMLKLRYDSDAALDVCDMLYMTFRNAVYAESVNLAKERGPFEGFDWEAEKDNEFIRDLPEHIREDMAKHGRRNIALLTNAPTGTVSMMSKAGKYNRHNTSSGIEPVWRVSYKRRRKGNPSDLNFRTDFVDELGDAWMEFDVKHSNLQNWEEEFGLNAGSDAIPDYFVSSDDINWKNRVRLQGIIQKYIDHAISSTINLPKGTSPDVVGGIYLEAWKNGLKGVTVYVDGSRTGVLVTDSSNRPTKIKRQEAPKRPQKVPCDIHWLSYKGKKWLAAVGMLDNEPYEMFAILDDGSISHTISEGILSKSARGKYSLITNGGTIKDIATPEFGWATRLISTSLRHGVPIDFLVEQLNKDGTSVDLNRVLARALKKYIREGKIRSSATCPECNSTNLAWKEGCMTCVDCGHSKCGQSYY